MSISPGPRGVALGEMKFQRAIGSVALLISLLFLIPFSPSMPESGLDPSWRYAINIALETGKTFGRDLVFTFGPLGSVYTTLFSPQLDTTTMIASAAVAIGICISVGLALSLRLYWVLLLPVVIAINPLRDSIFLVAPFFLLFSIIRVLLYGNSEFGLKPSRLIIFCIAISTFTLGLLPLVKGSFAGPVLACCSLAFIAIALKNIKLSVAFLIILLSGLIVGWFATSQPIDALADYFIAQAPIVSGYTNAMSLPANWYALVAIAGASLAISIVFYRSFTIKTGFLGFLALLGFVSVLFVGFKAGLVRADGHVFISIGVLFLLAILVSVNLDIKFASCLWICLIGIWWTVGNTAVPMGYNFSIGLVEKRVSETVNGIKNRIFAPNLLQENFAAAVDRIKQDFPLTKVSGTVDIYPTELSAVFANEFEWAGRPIIQSYSAYDPKLVQMNADHLRSPGAAQNIFLGFSSIDARLPALDDSRSLVDLLSQYHVTAYADPYVQLKRNSLRSENADIASTPTSSLTAKMGQAVRFVGDGPVWMTAQIRPTLLGRIVGTLYQLPEVMIEMELGDGRIISHRYIPAIGSIGFIASPYIASPQDFIELAAGLNSTGRVASVKFTSDSSLLWSQEFSVELRQISISPQPGARELVLAPLAAKLPRLLNSLAEPVPACTVDLINGRAYTAGRSYTVGTGLKKLDGWIAPSNSLPSTQAKTYIALTDVSGNTIFYNARTLKRPDVAKALNRQELDSAGFSATIDLSNMNAPITATFLTEIEGIAYQCREKITFN